MAESESNTRFSAIWALALEEYRSDTNKDPTSTPLEADSPDALLAVIDEKQRTFKHYRSKGEKIRRVLKPILELVLLFSEAAGEGTALTFLPSKAIFVAIRVLLGAAKNVTAKYDAIIDVFEEMGNFLDRLRVYMQQDVTAPMRKIFVEILSQMLRTFGIFTKFMKRNRLTHYFRGLVGMDDVKGELEKLRGLSNQEIQMATTVTLVNTTEIVNKLRDEFETKIRAWLSPPDPSTNHNTASHIRQSGTGEWFVGGDDFQNWTQDPNSFIWIRGIPGNGKTVLCSKAIDTLQHRYHGDASVAVAYFYFDFNDHAKMLFRAAINSLITQLVAQCHGTIPITVKNIYTRCYNGTQQPSYDDLTMVLKEMAACFDRTFIVLDALDECAGLERTSLLQFLSQMKDWGLASLRTLVTSRSVLEIEDAIASQVDWRLDLQTEARFVNQDIQMYLDSLLSRDFSLRKWGAEEKAMISETLLERACGMFQWIRCQLDTLRMCVSYADLEAALVGLPKTLDATYERILQNIPEDHQPRVHTILQFLCFSASPMTLQEIAEVVTIEEDSLTVARYEPRRRLRSPEDVLTLCGSLVSLSSKTVTRGMFGWSTSPVDPAHSSFGKILRPSHFSVQEFLISQRIQAGKAWNYGINAGLAHRSMGLTCIAYLLRFDGPDGSDTNRMTHRDSEVALSPYASWHWMEHFQAGGAEACIPLRKLALELLHHPRCEQFLNWIRVKDPDPRPNDMTQFSSERDTEETPNPLYYSALYGWVEISRHLLGQGADIGAKGSTLGNALQAASYGGHEGVVNILLDRGLDVNVCGGDYGNALQAASHKGHEPVVSVLLTRGAHVNAQGGYFGNALQAAAAGGHESIVRLLLGRGASVDSQEGCFGNVLQAAAFAGSTVIVRLLLERGMDVNMFGGDFGTALYAASCCGHKETVQLLIERGADVNAEGGDNCRYALHAAALRGHIDVVQLLLEGGADVDAEDPGGNGTALGAARYIGDEEIVQLLIANGADIEKTTGNTDPTSAHLWDWIDDMASTFDDERPLFSDVEDDVS